MERPLDELAASIDVDGDPGWGGIYVTRVIEDSRLVEPGDLFVAFRGAERDGHDYIDQAIDRGAVAVVTERRIGPSVPELVVPDGRSALARLAAVMYGRPTERLFTVGVTGTNGKTTVAHLVSHVIGERETELITTVANEGRGLRAVTTPSSRAVQEIALTALRAGKENLVVEASSIALDQKRLEAVDFDAAVFTNITHDHLDYHRDMRSYLAAKLILFKGLKGDAVAIVNADDPVSDRVASSTVARILTYGIDSDVDLRASMIEYSDSATSFLLEAEGGSVRVEIRLPAEYNVYNALAAAGVGLAKGISLEDIGERLAGARSVPGRYETFRAVTGATVIVDFAHSPDALERTLRFLRRDHPRVICLFGCPGESDRGKRPLMGKISGKLADLTILTADNPKGEDPEAIIDEIAEGVREAGGRYEKIVDRKEAIRRAVRGSRDGDAVLIAGKGHETYQIIGSDFLPHSDSGLLLEGGLVER